jgi:uncharacterized protein (TIGR03066 family)
MNAFRLLAVGAVAIVFAVGARAEEKADLAKMLIGKWEITKADEGTIPVGTIVEFTKDGKCSVTMKVGDKEEKMDGKYKVEAHKFTVMFKQGDTEMSHTITVTKITDKEMTTKDDDGKVVESKKKS